jgi:hypothetical protein
MEEKLISFETAKLAKEKGLILNNCKTAYSGTTIENSSLIYTEESFYYKTYILAPTQSLLQKWLRDEHHIFIDISFRPELDHQHMNWFVELQTLRSWNATYNCANTIQTIMRYFQTYEEALEAGLLESLNLIKNA